MLKSQAALLHPLQHAMQVTGHFIIICTTVALVATTLAAAFGALPWPELSLRWGAQYSPNAGMYGQIGLTALMVMLCFFLPATTRMARLERSHRSFQISMQDVRRA